MGDEDTVSPSGSRFHIFYNTLQHTPYTDNTHDASTPHIQHQTLGCMHHAQPTRMYYPHYNQYSHPQPINFHNSHNTHILPPYSTNAHNTHSPGTPHDQHQASGCMY